MITEFGGYAADVIAGRPERFQGIEVEGVREVDGHCQVDNDAPEFFSTYLRLKPEGDDVGVQCVGDFESIHEAIAYAESLALQYGWQIRDRGLAR
jgi:hypothetical protein